MAKDLELLLYFHKHSETHQLLTGHNTGNKAGCIGIIKVSVRIGEVLNKTLKQTSKLNLVKSLLQNQIWESETNLWEHIYKESPVSYNNRSIVWQRVTTKGVTSQPREDKVFYLSARTEYTGTVIKLAFTQSNKHS